MRRQGVASCHASTNRHYPTPGFGHHRRRANLIPFFTVLLCAIVMLVILVSLIRRDSGDSGPTAERQAREEPRAAPEAPETPASLAEPISTGVSAPHTREATRYGTPATNVGAGGDTDGLRCRHGVPMQQYCRKCACGELTPREAHERLHGDWTSD